MIKHTQLAYDESLWLRKRSLEEKFGKRKITFNALLIAGIEAFENGKSEEFDQAVEPVVVQPEKEIVPPEAEKPEKEEPEKHAGFLFYLDLPAGVAVRIFDVFDDKTKMWKETELEYIPNNSMFRIRDDGFVIALEGHKHFYKETEPVEKNGLKQLLIHPVKYNNE